MTREVDVDASVDRIAQPWGGRTPLIGSLARRLIRPAGDTPAAFGGKDTPTAERLL
ncbi:hypothetical protein ACIQ7Q_11045 [Streptomyces sp. NPDC096176]|uniref:hypothetical protein n=1 Tax=Streptomyces sp. NPDC096176 TaxID=3366079 RepID=UPI00380F677B